METALFSSASRRDHLNNSVPSVSPPGLAARQPFSINDSEVNGMDALALERLKKELRTEFNEKIRALSDEVQMLRNGGEIEIREIVPTYSRDLKTFDRVAVTSRRLREIDRVLVEKKQFDSLKADIDSIRELRKALTELVKFVDRIHERSHAAQTLSYQSLDALVQIGEAIGLDVRLNEGGGLVVTPMKATAADLLSIRDEIGRLRKERRLRTEQQFRG
jgi:hypothetical protein